MHCQYFRVSVITLGVVSIAAVKVSWVKLSVTFTISLKLY